MNVFRKPRKILILALLIVSLFAICIYLINHFLFNGDTSEIDENKEFVEVNNIAYIRNVYPLTSSYVKDILDFGDVPELIAFDDHYYYFSIRNFDNKVQLIKEGRNTENDFQIIYQSPQEFSSIHATIHDNKFYIADVFNSVEETYITKIIEVNNGIQKIFAEIKTTREPQITFINQNLVMSYEEYKTTDDNTYNVKCVSTNLDTLDIVEIDSSFLTVDDQGIFTGNFIRNIGGMDNILYYSKITYENSDSPQTFVTTLYRYSFDDTIVEEICNTNNLLIYLSGGHNFIITSSHYFSDNDEGYLYISNDNNDLEAFQIPHVMRYMELQGSYRISNDLIMLCNPVNIYLYNLNRREYQIINYRQWTSPPTYQTPIYSNGNIGYLEFVNSTSDTQDVLFNEILLFP